MEPRPVLGACCSVALGFGDGFSFHSVCLLLWAFIYFSTCFKEKEKRSVWRPGRWAASWELEPPLSSYWTFPNEVATLSSQCPQMHNFIWVQGFLDEFVLQDAKGHHNYLRHRVLRQIWILAAFGSLGFLYTHFGGPPQSLFDHLDCFLTFQCSECHSSSFLRSEQLTKNSHFQKQTLGVPQINSHSLKLMSLMMVREAVLEVAEGGVLGMTEGGRLDSS